MEIADTTQPGIVTNAGDRKKREVAPSHSEEVRAYYDSNAQKALECVIYSFLMLVYVPFYIISMLVVQTWLVWLKLRRRLGRHLKHGRLGIVSRRNRVTDVSRVSTDNEIDFLTHRSPCYLRRICFSMPWELVKTILRQEKIKLISDEQLAYIVLYTPLAYAASWDEERQMYRVDMEDFDHMLLYHGFYWDARRVLVRPDGKKIVIQMCDGKEYHSDCDERLRPTFNLAKLHAQVCITFYEPGLLHNHVHFVMPSAVAVLSQQVLDQGGTLYKLLRPHFRFTERINFQALRVQKASNNKRSKLDRLFFFWQPIPITKELFLDGIARKCKKHYFDKGRQECNSRRDEAASPSSISSTSRPTNGTSSFSSAYTAKTPLEDLGSRSHYLFPPDFVTDRELQRIPYLNFLRQYYLVIQDFVKSMIPFIDKAEWKVLSAEVAKHVPRFDKCDMVDALSTYIHQVGVMHSCDHNSYLQYFALEYGSMAIRVPFEPFENTEDWQEWAEENNVNVDDVAKDPLILMKQRDIMRTRSFLKIFVDFIPSSAVDLQLINTDYEFDADGAEMAAENFRAKLWRLDVDLKLQRATMPIRARSGEPRSEGMRLVNLDEIVRTVCF